MTDAMKLMLKCGKTTRVNIKVGVMIGLDMNEAGEKSVWGGGRQK